MKKMVDFLLKKKYFFKRLESLDLKEFGYRQKIEAFYGVDTNSFYTIIFYIQQKSRVLQKNADKYEEIMNFVAEKKEHQFKKKILVIESPLCSKAKERLSSMKWKVFHGSM